MIEFEDSSHTINNRRFLESNTQWPWIKLKSVFERLNPTDAHPYRDKEKSHEQTFEWIKVGFNFMTIFRFSQQSTPAINVPSAAERPIFCMSTATPNTINNVAAVKISRVCVPARILKTGRIKYRLAQNQAPSTIAKKA
jgi:hypothetical protein